MSEETKKNRYSEAQKRATAKYKDSHAKIEMIITAEEKERIKKAAADAGKSVTRFLVDRALNN